jgi:hypothetical protein
MDRESEPLPLNLPNSFIILAYQPADEKDEVQTSTQKFSVTRNQTVAELKSNMFRKYKGTHPVRALTAHAHTPHTHTHTAHAAHAHTLHTISPPVRCVFVFVCDDSWPRARRRTTS